MVILRGKSVFDGVAIGKLAFYNRKEEQIEKRQIQDTAQEIRRFEQAKEQAEAVLQNLHDMAVKEVGESNAMIFEIHQVILEDVHYMESVYQIITTEHVNAEYAVKQTADNFANMFAAMDDVYMQGRAADVKDVSQRVLAILSGVEKKKFVLKEPVILASDDFAPSETVQLDREKVLGFVTMYGSSNSHTAILAKTRNIPTIVSVGDTLCEEYDGTLAVIDGFDGTIYINPDAETLAKMQKKQERIASKKKRLESLIGKENVTLSGQKIEICANIGNSADIQAVLENDADGIGLFRSEFLYLENDTFPTEEQQFEIYKMAAECMAGKKVIIRTMDIGADKQADYFRLDKEDNSALGYRAIRICLTRTDIFMTQLRALYRASAFGQIAILFPMIISLEEVWRIKELIAQVKAELQSEGVAFEEQVELGIMIETPAAVMISRELAKEVDFFSVGTNDLIQYTLAIDRQNPKLDAFYNPHHLAVLRMIQMTAENAHAEGKWIGICGELGADLELTEAFLQMGIDELSVAPSMILPLRKRVREIK